MQKLHSVGVSCLLAALASGCASDPQRPRETPSEARPGMIAMTAGDFLDTDADRWRDTTTVAAYVYAASGAYPLPMKARGSFQFRLEATGGTELAVWNFDERQTQAALRQLAPGPGFVFQLNRVRGGASPIQDREAEILCTFTPLEGPPIRARPTAPLLVGPTSRESR